MIEGLVPATGSPNSENVLGEYPYSTRGWVSLQYKGWQCCANIDFLYVTVGLVHIDRMHVLREAGVLPMLVNMGGPEDFACTLSARE